MSMYGRHKNFIEEFELQSLIALSYYPELKDTRITFKFANKESFAKTTITFLSLFNSPDKHFIIYINSLKTSTGLIFQDVPFNAQVGAIGHELAHVSNFQNKSLLEIVWWGITYQNKKHRIKIERNTDASTIKHGLGWQLYDFVYLVLNDASVNARYKKFKQKNYLHPDEILSMIEKL